MKWKSGKTNGEFLPEKTFLIIKDDLESLTINQSDQWTKSTSAVDTGTWPPKIKKIYPSNDEERPKTANLEKPNVLDPSLVKKLDMSLLSKELLFDSITRIQSGGGMDTSNCRRSSTHQTIGDKRSVILNAIETKTSGTRYKRRSFDHLTTIDHHIRNKETFLESVIMRKQSSSSSSSTSNDRAVKKRSLELKKLDDNNNRNGISTILTNNINKPISTLSTVRTIKSSRSAISSEIEVFTSSINKLAPEPCKTCGRPDQPERFHSHPKGIAPIKIQDKDGNGNNKIKESERKTIQKPVALNFRSEKNKMKDEKNDMTLEKLNLTTNITNRSVSPKKGPKTVTCYICSREFGTASFPIHEPKCMEKWERENNALPLSKRRSVPQRPIVPVDDQQWNAVAWEQSQMQLVPCFKCKRTFLPDRLTVHEKTCKATPKNFSLLEKTDKVKSAGRNSNSLKLSCQICGRNFGIRSIKIHEPQCLKKHRSEIDTSINDQNNKTSFISTSLNGKRTTTCYICGRDFGTVSIDIHEPQCLKKWRIENFKLPLNQQRKEPQKPETIFQEDSSSGNEIIDWSATTEARWRSHLGQLIPCKHCKRTFNPDRVSIHERTCKGSR
ncbi:hypothetical protein PV328_001565 [Microctonus aethiopoides]|uniref:C2HC/C3H-type domain-containing protein n=1 Tax=Microctonus aethiopoides TaxID=144406 RepID=A0AA39KXG1_9HYME|nr:hypothetical protein PV328_001565 [Microctonus aethiopoides]